MISNNLISIKEILPSGVQLVVVSKTRTNQDILECYNTRHRIFGENRVQELVKKYKELPKDIEWHLIGHLQKNKVRYIASFISLIHSIDSIELLEEINKQALKFNRVINCLLEVKLSTEENKHGVSFNNVENLLGKLDNLKNVKVIGLMGMSTNTTDESLIQEEFHQLSLLFKKSNLDILSMGMSNDYHIAIKEGSNMVRIGNKIFN